MGYKDGWAAINMQMPDRVPRTEYSVQCHWELLKKVTGIPVSESSPDDIKVLAQQAFMKIWHFSFMWCTYGGSQFMKGRVTKMGHAVYAAGGVDYDTHIDCPFKDVEEVLSFDPVAEYGVIDRKALVPELEKHYRELCDYFAEAVNMTGVYTSMVSGLIEIFGWEMLLLAAGSDPKRFGEVAQRYEKWITPMFEALAESNVPVVMCHDDIVWTSGAFCHPDWYRRYIFPAYKRMWRPILDAGKRFCYTSDGDYTQFFDDIVECGAHVLVMEPSCDMAGFAQKYGKTHGFVGNADTRILLSGTKEEICAEVKRCMDIGKKCPGFFMAVGNHIPSNTPIENCLIYNDAYEEMAIR